MTAKWISEGNKNNIFSLFVNYYHTPAPTSIQETPLFMQGTLSLLLRVSPEYKGSTVLLHQESISGSNALFYSPNYSYW